MGSKNSTPNPEPVPYSLIKTSIQLTTTSEQHKIAWISLQFIVKLHQYQFNSLQNNSKAPHYNTKWPLQYKIQMTLKNRDINVLDVKKKKPCRSVDETKR